MSAADIEGRESGRVGGARTTPGTQENAPLEDERPARRSASSRVLGPVDRERLLQEARALDFPIALRGYDRNAVDRYVEKVTRLITELQMSASPEAAVRHALDEVSEETREILQHAHATAEEIAARSRARADDRLQQAEREALETREAAQREAEEFRMAAQEEVQHLRDTAMRETQALRGATTQEVQELRQSATREVQELRQTATREVQELRESAQREAEELRQSARRDADELVDAAETRSRELARNAETIWRERRRLLDDMRVVGEQLIAIGEVEGKRFARFLEENGSAGTEQRTVTPAAAT